MHGHEVHACEIHVYEVHAHEMHAVLECTVEAEGRRVGVVWYAALGGVYAVACKLIWVGAGERMLHRGIGTMQRR